MRLRRLERRKLGDSRDHLPLLPLLEARVADADVRRAFGTKAGTLYAQAAEELERWRWLKEDATSEQWERASHALDTDAEIDAMRRGA